MSPDNTIYISGPANSHEEKKSVTAIATLLENNSLRTYLPQRDGLEPLASTFALVGGTPERDRRNVFTLEVAAFALDIFQVIEKCDCLLFDMNGRVPDHESAFRAAVAFTAGKPVVLYKRDHRSKLHGNDNAMITGLSCDFRAVRETDTIPGEVAEAMRKARRLLNGRPAGRSPVLSIVSDLGGDVWKSLQRFNELDSGSDPSELLCELSSLCEASPARRLWG